MFHGEAVVVVAEEAEDGGVEVADVDGILDDVIGEFVGLAVDGPAQFFSRFPPVEFTLSSSSMDICSEVNPPARFYQHLLQRPRKKRCRGSARGYVPSMRLKAIIHEAEEGGFWAEVPALPGCVTQAETLPELEANLREAIEGWLLAAEPDGQEDGARILEVAV